MTLSGAIYSISATFALSTESKVFTKFTVVSDLVFWSLVPFMNIVDARHQTFLTENFGNLPPFCGRFLRPMRPKL